MSECIFCKIFNGQADASIVYRDDIASAFLDISPVNPGHVLVVPNEHFAGLADLPEKTAKHLICVAQRLASAIRFSNDIKCEGINLFLADGKAAGQEVFHVHLHIIPRFKNDGFRLVFSDHKPTRSELEELAVGIRKQLG